MPVASWLRIPFSMVALVLSAMFIGGCGSSDSGTSAMDKLSNETMENVARVLWMKDVDPQSFPPDVVEGLSRQINSESAFGERMIYLLEDMKTNPDSFTPSYADLYDTFMEYSDKLTPHQNYALVTSLGMEASRGHQELPLEKTFLFPEDDRPQFEYQAGWHFFVGSVFSESGQEFGVEFMFWHYAQLPKNIAEILGLSPIENQVVEMHLAVTPAGDRHYRAKPYVVAGTTGLVGFESAPFNYTLGDNFMRSLQPDTLFPIQLRAWGIDNTRDNEAVEMEIDITLRRAKPYMLNDDNGLAPSCGGVGTLYYSVSNLPLVAGDSWIKLNGEKIDLAKGKMWYDHQWGSSPSATNPRVDVLRAAQNLKEPEPDGWEWIAVMFDDDTEIALSVPKRNVNKDFYMQTGPEPPGVMTAAAYGKYMDRGGDYGDITGTIRVTEWTRSTVSHGQYTATNTWYPNRVEVSVETAEVPAGKREFILIPIVEGGQEGWFAPGWQYSEGAVYVDTHDGERIGRGFLELTGWADYKDQLLRIAGLPQTEEMKDLIEIRKPSEELVRESEAFLEVPQNAQKLLEVLATCRGHH